ncbi:GNAT family N-acetyltransferase [Pelomonas sp. V22]|uniref:GNAT family N-acetyltransferase n=1 Tax=Pelomonas sp. V22 TaxID=2822139 RepID=UPI0024A841C6|nr:GNAT family N-acyltransferase [Pelomonas sp. V22]MDI4634213.1 GNAT family N-acetyltransferase [Pelomonas sp. V22]
MRDLPLPTLPFAELNSADRRSLPAAMPQTAAAPRLDVAWARTQEDLSQAQALRYQVFVGEMGAQLSPPPGTPAGFDVDRFDAFCEHLLVRTVEANGRPGMVIGTYRVLTPDAARRAGGLYSETEFDLSPLAPLRSRMVELGRSCVHPDHRAGGVIMTLWAALGEFMQRNDLDTMIGCASVSMRDGGHYAASLWKRLSQSHLAAPEWQVLPRLALPVNELDQSLDADPPPLIKGYLRCGARVLGAPAWDPDFNTADLPLMMRISELPARYRRHFLGE